LKILKYSFALFLFSFSILLAKNNENLNVITNAESDSLNLMAEASLFFEAYKNKQFDDWTIEKGFNMLNAKPDAFAKYHPYRKLDKVIWAVHDDSTTSEAEKAKLADTVLYLYKKAVKYDSSFAGNYYVREGYVWEVWKNNVDSAIAYYEKGLNSGQNIIAKSYYMDRLGELYAKNATDENGYKLKALDIYSALSDEEPDNPLWPQKMASLAEDENQLMDILHKSWQMDKENSERAWKYASTCIRFHEYEKAIEPLEFLTKKQPDVINYWRELARAYEKTDKYDKAISAYKKLIALQPDNRDNYVNIALIYKKLDQLSVARSYLHKALKVSPNWDYPVYIEGTLYEQAARECGFDFEDKVVYQLAVNTYRRAKNLGGEYASVAAERIDALKNSVPTKEDYFFRHYKNGDEIKIAGKCYGWINKSIKVHF